MTVATKEKGGRMKVVVGIILVIAYLTIGYVVTAVIDTLEGSDVEESFSCWTLWPFVLVGYLVIKIVLWIGERVWPAGLFKRSEEEVWRVR